MKRLVALIFMAAWLGLFARVSRAADQTVTCTNSGCSGLMDSLFNDLSVAPAGSVTRSIDIYNNEGETMKIALAVSESAGTDDDFTPLVDVRVVTDTVNTRFSGTLDQFLGSYIDLEKLETNHHRLVEITLALADVGNEYQGKKAKFSFDLKINQEPGGTVPTASVSPLASPLIAGLTVIPKTTLAGVLGEATPSAEARPLAAKSYPWWACLMILPPLAFFLLKWQGKRRRIS